jgi:predicted DsbA family dithiol-disulfide isomerase
VATPVRIRHFTDPGCPFAFTAERQRMRLRWLYGDQLQWELRMIVLSEEGRSDAVLAERFSASYRRLYDQYGMPIDWRPLRWLAPSVHACRAVVAVRMRWPGAEDAYLRHLRVQAMGGALLDDSDTLEIAAERAGLPVGELADYAADPEVQAALEADMAAARAPSPAALAQPDRLGGPAGARRYSCPTYEIELDGRRLDVPGFQPLQAYEGALANLAPDLERRDDPESVEEVLEWAPYALATAEVAAVMERDIADVRLELSGLGATFAPMGGDGYWIR